MYLFSLLIFSLLSFSSFATAQITSKQALKMLMEGNQRFVEGKTSHPSLMSEAKDKLIEKQTPFATILSCSDSRVPPELIFDQGVGQLFVVRDAGNVVSSIEMDSIEFAVAHLKTPLVLVLGHQNCGAVQATLQDQASYPELESIFPLIDNAFKTCDTIGDKSLVNGIRCNVKNSVQILKNSPTIAPLISKKQVQVIGAYYEIETGKVTLIP